MKSISNDIYSCIIVYDQLIEIAAGRPYNNLYLNAALQHVFKPSVVCNKCCICEEVYFLKNNFCAFMDKPTLLINSWLIKLLNKGIVTAYFGFRSWLLNPTMNSDTILERHDCIEV